MGWDASHIWDPNPCGQTSQTSHPFGVLLLRIALKRHESDYGYPIVSYKDIYMAGRGGGGAGMT